MTPLKRFSSLLNLDRRDISQIFFYAIVAGIISLSLPLGIQTIINFIQSGRVSVSWIVLVVIVVGGVALVGLMSLMQLRITENLQQKIFVRSSFEFAYRLPRLVSRQRHSDMYLPELANRFFDTLTIQKGVAKLLLDFSAALLQISFGIILLSLYHPFFIVFGLLLLLVLYLLLKVSYRPGLETSLIESKYKYRVADWLQEVARNQSTFKAPSSFRYALGKNDELVGGYLKYREKHFNVLKTQFSRLIVFKALITAGLLLIGGFLVLDQQMNIGQFVAAEIVIIMVISSVEKIIIGFESLYDVLTAVEKIGQVTDMEMEPEETLDADPIPSGKLSLEVEGLRFRYPDAERDTLKNLSFRIDPGEKIILRGVNGSGKTTLLRILSGLLTPTSGSFLYQSDTFHKVDIHTYRSAIGVIVHGETPFEGTILDNITFGDPSISAEDVRWAVDAVQLGSYIKTLPDGLETKILPEGKQLSFSNAQKILLARSIVRKPSMLFYEDPTDRMDADAANAIIDFLCAKEHQWALVVVSSNNRWVQRCTRYITMEKGKIIEDQKN
ncbi:MAG TPA: ATP-binding cassette domain-containing protein [Flavobacterium sp.]|nr:ATP-binding cassette domain-containing protein [Flavobacterium sp.]